jgi:hypothetical protein
MNLIGYFLIKNLGYELNGILNIVRDVRTRVLLVRFKSDPDPRNHGAQIRFTAVILYSLEVKRQLATLEAATRRAIELARQIIQRRCYLPPDLDALTCTAEVTMFDLRPFADAAWIQEDGTKVFLTEAARPLRSDWGGRR